GKTGRDRSCCEAIILAYPAEGRNFLEDQVSILLEADLPTYYSQHRFQVTRRLTDYRFFLDVAKCVVYDSRREGPEIREVKWSKPSIVRDLADSSLLPIRQGIGQFLSGFDPKELAVGLRSVRVSCSKETEAEAVILCDWVREAMERCARIAECPMEAEFRCCPIDQAEGFALEIHFSYDDDRYFHWKADWKTKIAEIDADFGRGRMQLPTTLKTFDPETALAEALFF